MAGARFELRQAELRFPGATALQPTSLEFTPGEAVAIVGPSGAGKTTLLRLLNGSLQPSRGSVLLNGQDFGSLGNRALREQRSRIGFVHQDLALVPNLRVSQNVLAGRLGRQGLMATLRSMFWPARSELDEAYRILDRVGIAEKLFWRTDKLSGGQQQRVAIARALYQDPCAVLADEPVSSVDPARARDTVALLSRLCQQSGFTLVASLHNRELAQEFFPRLIGLRQGAVLFDSPASAVSNQQFSALYEMSERDENA